MKINGKFKKYYSKKWSKDLLMFNFMLYRADGKLENFSIKSLENGIFKMENTLIYSATEHGKFNQTITDIINTERLEDSLESALSLKSEFKKIHLSDHDGLVFLALWEKI